MIFSSAVLQHVRPERIAAVCGSLQRLAARWIVLIEYCDGSEDFFAQPHLYRHDYRSLFAAPWRCAEEKRVPGRTQPATWGVYVFAREDA